MLLIDDIEMSEIMSIFILEDDVIQAQQLKRLVEEICIKHQLKYDFMEVTSRSADIIEKISHTTYVPIYFLDIEINDEKRKGLQVAKEIRAYDSQGIIVFVTTHYEFAPISYQYMVSAFTFIDKGLPDEERYNMFEKCLLHYQACNVTSLPTDDFVVENNHTTLRVPFAEVEYMMTDQPHRLSLVATERMINFYGTLKEIESLDERLFRCHQSFVVNKRKICAYDATEKMILLKSGNKIPVSRRLVRKVRQIIKDEL